MLGLDASAEWEALGEDLLESETLKMKLLQGLVSETRCILTVYMLARPDPITLEAQFTASLLIIYRLCGTAGYWGNGCTTQVGGAGEDTPWKRSDVGLGLGVDG